MAETAQNEAGKLDYRFSLANERTFLAWIRTALALNAGAVAVWEFLPPLAVAGARHVLGLLLVGLGSAAALGGYRRWRANEAAMREDRPLPGTRLPAALAAGVVTVSVLAVILLLAPAS